MNSESTSRPVTSEDFGYPTPEQELKIQEFERKRLRFDTAVRLAAGVMANPAASYETMPLMISDMYYVAEELIRQGNL